MMAFDEAIALHLITTYMSCLTCRPVYLPVPWPLNSYQFTILILNVHDMFRGNTYDVDHPESSVIIV